MLTFQECRGATGEAKRRFLADGDGLFLSVSPKGKKSWVVRYRKDGKQEALGLGAFPAISLSKAREKRDAIHAAAATGSDVKAAVSEGDTSSFGHYFELWWRKTAPTLSSAYGGQAHRRMERYVLPALGNKPMDAITPQEVLGIIQKVEAKGHFETARRLKDHIGRVFKFAKFDGVDNNPVEGINERLAPRPKQKHMPFVHPKDMPQFFAALGQYDGERQTKLLLEIIIRTMVRTNELRDGRWSEIHGNEWSIPAARMKMQRDHVVPIVPQVAALFEELKGVCDDPAMWGSHRGTNLRPTGDEMCAISENGMLFALYRMGYKGRATVHGFRRTASTYLNECGKFRPDVIEMQLAHVEGNKVRGAYNAATYMAERRAMLEHWNGVIDQWQATGELLS
ncbi:tyrosine-type recombinase/integrase [Marivita sp. S2033]|uniref:tyrosine-type recombinase/integrase n=1 Tax=Marivita sp. S2033 TaxID=3373187 RepID=UPI003981EA2E